MYQPKFHYSEFGLNKEHDLCFCHCYIAQPYRQVNSLSFGLPKELSVTGRNSQLSLDVPYTAVFPKSTKVQ